MAEIPPIPMDPGSEYIYPLYLALSIFSFAMTFILYKKWRSHQKYPTKLLFLTFLAYSICITIITIGFTEVILTEFKGPLYRFSLAAGYAGIMLSNILLLLFAAEIFEIDRQELKKYIIGSIIIAIILALPNNFYGIPAAYIDGFNIRAISQGLMTIFSIITYSKIYQQAMRISNKVDDKMGKTAFKLIGYSQICMIMLFVFLLLDTIMFGVLDTLIFGIDMKGFTIFAYLGWISAGLFYIFCYLGLIMPNWLKNRLQ